MVVSTNNMSTSNERLGELLKRDEFPLSSRYDPRWIIDNQMGPNALWLTEWLCKDMELHSGMRVLDLGCGKGLSSIFMAKEYFVQVWATDLWISATDNSKRIQQAGISDTVFPIHAEARSLPYAEEFFDAIVCVDAYIYFGTDDLYFDYLHKFVKPGGQIGIVLPGFMQKLDGPLPEHLIPFWAQECWTWHTMEWWERHWSRTGLVEVEVIETMPDGCDVWLQWERARMAAGDESESLRTDIEVMGTDRGEFMGFIRMIARR
jgi:cyclopropane fatty-acyl-phospholipid synthase-like methyltransferase